MFAIRKYFQLNTIKYLSNSINTNPIKFNGLWSVNRYMVYNISPYLYQIIFTYFITLIILLIIEQCLANLIHNYKFNISSLLNFFLISIIIFIPTMFLFTKLDKWMFYSDDKKQYSVLNRRTFLLYFLKVSFFGIVGWRLYDIQIKNSQKYKTSQKTIK